MLVKHSTGDLSSADPHQSQERRILAALLAANGAWVSALDLAKISLQYSARIHHLRWRGAWGIENKIEHTADGRKRGYFRIRQFVTVEHGRLMSTPVPARMEQRPEPRAQPKHVEPQLGETAPLLFPEMGAHRDDG